MEKRQTSPVVKFGRWLLESSSLRDDRRRLCTSWRSVFGDAITATTITEDLSGDPDSKSS